MRVRRPLIDSLQVKLTLAFLLIALTPLGVGSLFAVRTADRAIESVVSSQLENMAADKQELLKRWMAERRADLEVVAGSAAARSADPELVGPYLNLLCAHYGVYRRFVIADRTGKVVFDTAGTPVRAAGDGAWLREASAGRRYMSPVRLASGSQESTFDIAAPILGADGVVGGAVCATVSTRSILQSVLAVSLGETGECYLVDRAGTFLVHKDPRKILRENITGSGSFARVFGQSGPGAVYTDYRRIAVLGASRAVPGTPWYLVVEQDEQEAFAPSYRLRWRIYAAIALSAIVAVAVSLLLAHYVSRPVELLSEAATAIARGEFDHPSVHAGTARRDEIGVLRAAFEDMADQLRERQISLQRRADQTAAQLEQTDRRLQHTIEAAARSEHLAAMGRLASGVAHEIRTPLASLKLYLQSVREEMTLAPDMAEDFQIAMRQVERIEKTIHHFLNFARPSEPVFTRLAASRFVEEALLVVRPRANHQKVAVVVERAPDLPPLFGDSRQLGEAVVNLLVNALEAMAEGGRLTITLAPETMPADGDSRPGVRIDVADTGPGIAPDDLARIFEPFYTTKASGSGLGLAIVRGTVERHGGVLRVRSDPGEGATFSLILPAAPSEDVSDAPASDR